MMGADNWAAPYCAAADLFSFFREKVCPFIFFCACLLDPYFFVQTFTFFCSYKKLYFIFFRSSAKELRARARPTIFMNLFGCKWALSVSQKNSVISPKQNLKWLYVLVIWPIYTCRFLFYFFQNGQCGLLVPRYNRPPLPKRFWSSLLKLMWKWPSIYTRAIRKKKAPPKEVKKKNALEFNQIIWSHLFGCAQTNENLGHPYIQPRV